MVSTARLPLQGVRIASITVVLAGPFATRLLADLGAEVICIESCQHWQSVTRGFRARPHREFVKRGVPYTSGYPDWEPGERPWNRNPFFNAHASNKLSMTVDLTRQKGMEIFKRLIKKCDVFLENNHPQTMEKLGITYQMLRDEKPDIIYVRMPAFGLSGPYRDFRAYGSHLEAFSGHSMLRGYLDMDPTSLSHVVASDASAAVHAAFAVISALLYRDRTGNGQLIELAQVESFIPFLAYQLMDYAMNRRVQSTSGNRFPGAAPSGCYRCKGEDKWVMIVCHNDKEWEGFCRALGNPLWTKDKKFADALSRYKNQDELNKLIQHWAIQNDPFEIFHLLQKEGVPAAPVEDYRDAYNDPHLKARGFFEQVTQADCGTHFYPGVQWKFSKTPLSVRLPPCRLGEHNEYIYKRIIGVPDDEYTELQKEGHIGMDFIPEIP